MKTIPYGHQYIEQDDIDEVIKVLQSDWITQGPKIKEFEDAVCKYTGAKFAVAVANGTAALHIACLAAGIKKNDRVITSPITFAASANCVLYCGGKPVFVDVQSDTINIDPVKIKSYLKSLVVSRESSVKAIIPVHFAGHPCDMEEIHKIAKKNNLIVIEDAAHAFGAKYYVNRESGIGNREWIKIGSCVHSNMTILSFHPVKHITTGEGGMVLTNNKKYYEKLLLFRSHGITKNDLRLTHHDSRLTGSWYYEMQCLGYNYRITDFQCALGLNQLKKLDMFVNRRREIVAKYKKAFSKATGIECLAEKEYVKSSWHIFPVLVKDALTRKKVFDQLRSVGIGVNVHYIPVYWQPYYQELGYKTGTCPNAEEYYTKTITLPIYPAMTDKQVNFVMKKLIDTVKKTT